MLTLPDHLRSGLRLVLVGLNPGTYSARAGTYFARRGNRFWPALSQSGLVPREVQPGDEAQLLEWGIGLTDVVKRTTDSIDDLDREDWRKGARGLERKIARWRPAVVAFVGLRGAREVLGRHVAAGLHDRDLAGARAVALPSTSGRNAAYSKEAIFAAFRQLADVCAACDRGGHTPGSRDTRTP